MKGFKARKDEVMCGKKTITDYFLNAASLIAIILFGFFLSACAALGPSRAAINPANALDAAKMTMASTADEFNRSLGAPTKGDLVEPADFSVGPQDLLEVNLFNIDATDGIPSKVQVRVSNSGQITLPLLGQMRVGGLTRAQVEESLQQGYRKFMHEPDVGVTLVENRSNSVYVLGAVKSPGVLPLTGEETLRRVLAMAGGITPDAGMYVHVSRQKSEKEQAYVINLSELANDPSGKLNVLIRPGDFVNVPRAGSFFVDGQVERPNAYQLVQPYRLSQALAIAGGLSNFASTEIAILRRGPKGEMQTLSRDLDKIRSGQEEDLQIVESDLIIVPPSKTKVFLSVLLSAVGYTSRSQSYSFGIGRVGGALGGGIGGALLP
jgi:polysaccharide export outer membrane protein